MAKEPRDGYTLPDFKYWRAGGYFARIDLYIMTKRYKSF